MPEILPLPPERFDAITARWVTPGGPLHDPQRDDLDPDHNEPVTLVTPIPPELAGKHETGMRDGAGRPPRSSPSARLRWAILALLAAGIAAVAMSTRTGSCPDPGECTIVWGGGPIGWIAVLALIGLTIYAARRAVVGK